MKEFLNIIDVKLVLVEILLLLLAIIALIKNNDKANYLSYHIRNKKRWILKQSHIEYRKNEIIDFFKRIRYKLSDPLVSLPLSIVFTICYHFFITNLIPTSQNFDSSYSIEYLQNIWTIYAGTLAITVTVVVFLVNSVSRKSNEDNLFSIFFKESYIFPIIYFSLSNIVLIGLWLLFYKDKNLESFTYSITLAFTLSVMGIGFLYVIAYKLMGTEYLSTVRIKWLKWEIDYEIEKEIERRLGRDLFHKTFESLNLDYSYYWGLKKSDLEKNNFYINKKGIIIDVNMKKLERLQQIVNKENLNVNTSYPKFQFSGLSIGDYVDNSLIAVINLKNDIKKCQKIINSVLKIKEPKKATFSLEQTFDEFKIAIRDLIILNRPEKLDDYLNLYYSTLTAFIKKMNIYQISEGKNLFDRWFPQEKIAKDMFSLVDETIKVEIFDCFSQLISFVIKVLKLSFDHRIFITFKEFLRLFPYVYFKAYSSNNNYFKDQVFDECSLLLRDFVRYNIQKSAEETKNAEMLEKINKYILEIYNTYNQLFIISIENNNVDQFKKLIDRFKKIQIQYVDDRHNFTERIFDLEFKIKKAREEKTDFSNLEKELEYLEKTMKIIEEKYWYRNLILFGMNSWLILLYVTNISNKKISKETFLLFYQIIENSCEDVIQLTNLYSDAINKSNKRLFLWENLELQAPPEDETYTPLSSDLWLPWYYCVKGISYGKYPKNIEAIKQSDTFKEFRFKIIYDICENIRKDYYMWKDIININLPVSDQKKNSIQKQTIKQEQFNKQIDEFLEFNQLLLMRFDKTNEEKKIAKKLSQNKIQEFTKQFIKIWHQGATPRLLVKKYSTYKEIQTKDEHFNEGWFGYNVVDEKGAYIEGDEHYFGWANSYANGFIKIENNMILRNILRCCSKLDLNNDFVIDISKVDEILDTMINLLVSSEYKPNMIIIPNHWWHSKEIMQNENFLLRWKIENPLFDFREYVGQYKKLPVFCFYEEIENIIGVFDLKKFCELIQYTDSKFLEKVFHFSIKPYNEKSALDLINRKPEFKKNKEGNELSDEDAVRVLLQKVNIVILEKFEFNILDPKAGRLIELR